MVHVAIPVVFYVCEDTDDLCYFCTESLPSPPRDISFTRGTSVLMKNERSGKPRLFFRRMFAFFIIFCSVDIKLVVCLSYCASLTIQLKRKIGGDSFVL